MRPAWERFLEETLADDPYALERCLPRPAPHTPPPPRRAAPCGAQEGPRARVARRAERARPGQVGGNCCTAHGTTSQARWRVLRRVARARPPPRPSCNYTIEHPKVAGAAPRAPAARSDPAAARGWGVMRAPPLVLSGHAASLTPY